MKYLNNFGDLKSKSKFIRFTPKVTNPINNNMLTSNLNNLTGLNSNNSNSHLNSHSNLNNLYSPHQKENTDYQFKNLSLISNPPKKNYDSNFSANNATSNKYNHYGQSDVLNTSELVNDENQYHARMDSQNKSSNTGNFLVSSNQDLITSDPNFRPSSSSKN